jgi:hypothetical protein
MWGAELGLGRRFLLSIKCIKIIAEFFFTLSRTAVTVKIRHHYLHRTETPRSEVLPVHTVSFRRGSDKKR